MFVPSVKPDRPADCNPSRVAPAADIALGVVDLMPFTFLAAFSADGMTCINDRCEKSEGKKELIGPAVVFGALIVTHFVAAKVGFRRARECRELRARQVYAPPGYPPPASYPPPYPSQPYPQPQPQGVPR